MKSIVKPIVKNPKERIELLSLLHEWLKTEQDPMFWDCAKRINLCIARMNISTRENNFLVRGIVSLVRLAQLAAFRDGMRRGRKSKEKARRR